MASPFDGIAQFLTGRGGGAAATGSVDILDVLGIGSQGRRTFAANQAAGERTAAALAQEQAKLNAGTMAEARKQEATRLMVQRFQAHLEENGGDVQVALTSLIRDPALSEAFALSADAVNTFFRNIMGPMSNPAAGLVRELQAGGRVMEDRSGDAGYAPDPAAMPGPGAFGSLTPQQREAALAAARISPQAAATAASAALNAQAFPPAPAPPAAFTLAPGAVRFGPDGQPIAANPRAPVPDAQMGRVLAQRIGRVSEDGDAAREMGLQLGELRTALQGARGAGFWSRVAGHLGIPTGNSDIETVQAIVNKLAPQQRVPGSGHSSDADVRIFFRALPTLMQSAAGQERILNTMEAMVQDRIARGTIADRALSGELTPQQAFEQLRALRNPFHQERLEDMSDAALRALSRNEAAMADPAQRARVLAEMRRRRDRK